jgi:LPS-assembly lipoprotein
MWSRSSHAALGRLLRWLAVAAAAGLTAGCFQPLYGEYAATTGPGAVAPNVRDAFATVQVNQIAAPNGTPEARIAVEVRNNVIWELTGGGGAGTPAYLLAISMKMSKTAMIVDIATGRTEAEIVGIDVSYTLTEIGTKKVVVNSQTFARVSSDVPGLQQRFAHQRAQRDAEDRAAKVIAEQIRSRLASYFVAGA